MQDHFKSSPFTHAAAVEAWDAWFRWREDGQLRDWSIEATWHRVARALATPEPAPALWIRRWIDVQSTWQVLFDERILASAGTARACWPCDPVAVLNLSSFVHGDSAVDTRFDVAALRSTAELALHALDNALLCCRDDGFAPIRPRVGVIGFGDALQRLGQNYDSAFAREFAGEIGSALAQGCLACSVRLARDRGAAQGDLPAYARHMPSELLADIARYGVRHLRTTAITSQPRLALFANNTSDALDPPLATPADYAAPAIRVDAQIAVRSAMQPWIDAPIDYPFRVGQAPDLTARLASKVQLDTAGASAS